jgi:hypothetical protein
MMKKVWTAIKTFGEIITIDPERLREQVYLSMAVDHCDFERRMNEINRGAFRSNGLIFLR